MTEQPNTRAVMPELLRQIAANLPRNPRNLLTNDQHRQLDEDLAQLAQLRRRAEVTARNVPIGDSDD